MASVSSYLENIYISRTNDGTDTKNVYTGVQIVLDTDKAISLNLYTQP